MSTPTDSPLGRRWHPVASSVSKVALVFPGRGYGHTFPLLEFVRQGLLEHGWSVLQVEWTESPPTDWDETVKFVNQHAERAILSESHADKIIMVGKSLGSMAAVTATKDHLPGIWFTPLLMIDECARAHLHSTAPSLVIGGTADESWVGEVVTGLECEILEIPDADHGLTVPGKTVRSAEIQVEIARRTNEFLNALD